jgi:multisubunit Na+/H+ antiporter MnhC subunit
MCFSAEASFAGSAVISAIGVVTLTKVKKPTQILFAAIPFIFGIQQCAEGVLWVTLKSDTAESLQYAGMYIFLTTALIIWPTMVPLSIWLLEKGKQRRKVLAGLIAAGGIVSLFYTCCLILYDVYPQIQNFHIAYVDDFPRALVMIAFVIYLVVTITPLFVSSVKRMWLFGVLMAVSCLISGIFFAEYLTSVWCFFAALISIAIYWIFGKIQSETRQIPEASTI